MSKVVVAMSMHLKKKQFAKNFRVNNGACGLWAVDSLGSGINAAWVGIGNWVCDAGQMCKWTVLETKGARQDW